MQPNRTNVKFDLKARQILQVSQFFFLMQNVRNSFKQITLSPRKESGSLQYKG